MKFRSKYEFSIEIGHPHHVWTVVGRHLAIHLNITDYGEDHAKKYGERYSGGIEIHYRQPPEYMKDDAPSQDHCWLLKAPCWHDGSSLQVTERWIPHWLEFRGAPDEHERMFALLEAEVENHTSTTLEVLSKSMASVEGTNE